MGKITYLTFTIFLGFFFSRALFNIRKKYIFFKDFSKTFDKKYIFLFQNF